MDGCEDFKTDSAGYMSVDMLNDDERFPFDRWMELYAEVIAANRVTEDDEKN